MAKREIKDVSIEIKSVGEDGTFEGYGNTFTIVDSYGERVVRGAFTNTLKNRLHKIRLLWQHDQRQPIGVWTEAYEDDKGLFVKGKLVLETQQGREAYALLKAGAIDSMSIGFSVIKDEMEEGVRLLKEVKLWEISLVTFPANEDSEVTSIKSLFDDLDEKSRVKVVSYINNLKQSLDCPTEPPITEASVEKHSEEPGADAKQSEDPQGDIELKQSLERLLAAIR